MKFKYKDTQGYAECPECVSSATLEPDELCGLVVCTACEESVCLLSEVETELEGDEGEPDGAALVTGRGGCNSW